MGVTVEEELPLKQGLKHYFAGSNVLHIIVEEELPLKQGLKPENREAVRQLR